MFLVGKHEVRVIRTSTENPRIGSSILSLGTRHVQPEIFNNIKELTVQLVGSFFYSVPLA
jgi:hypothetical protein